MYDIPQLFDIVEYRNTWLKAEQEFAINCFSIIGCYWEPQNIVMPETINPFNELEDLIDIKDVNVAITEVEKKGSIPLNDFIKELGL